MPANPNYKLIEKLLKAGEAGRAELAEHLLKVAPELLRAHKNFEDREQKVTVRLDKLELFHREMDDWDRKMNPDKTMWVLFAKKGAQGTTRRIIDASIS